MQKFCLALDLKNDPNLIAEYEQYHKAVWPEVIESITVSGIINMEIYRVETRLFMIIIASDDFSFKEKEILDKENSIVKKWENLMDTFQQRLPFAQNGEKWMLMKQIFELK